MIRHIKWDRDGLNYRVYQDGRLIGCTENLNDVELIYAQQVQATTTTTTRGKDSEGGTASGNA